MQMAPTFSAVEGSLRRVKRREANLELLLGDTELELALRAFGYDSIQDGEEGASTQLGDSDLASVFLRDVKLDLAVRLNGNCGLDRRASVGGSTGTQFGIRPQLRHLVTSLPSSTSMYKLPEQVGQRMEG